MCFFLMSIYDDYGHTKGYITNRRRMALKRSVRRIRSLSLATIVRLSNQQNTSITLRAEVYFRYGF